MRPAELPALVHRCLSQIKAEVDHLLKLEDKWQRAEVCCCPAEGFRCRHQLPCGRCGFRAEQRN